MKAWLFVIVLCSGCASLHNPNGSINVSQVLNDARWGVMEACDVQWLTATDCTFAVDAFTLADGIVAQNLIGSAVAVRQLLMDAEAKLPAASRLRPYLDAVIALLPAS
jgi:hypothetical protein